jgi:hypothetical protein
MSLHCFDEAVENTLLLPLLLLARENRQTLCEVTITPGQRVAKPATEHSVTVRSMHYKRLFPWPLRERFERAVVSRRCIVAGKSLFALARSARSDSLDSRGMVLALLCSEPSARIQMQSAQLSFQFFELLRLVR